MGQNFIIEDELKKLPKQPGVYIMHDANDEIIYVGKAVSLRNRVRQYFQSTKNKTAKVIQMVQHIDHFEYIVTDSELEALVLESNLIKQNRPKYNTMLKDDKTYPYIKVTVGEMYPRIMVSRSMKKDSSRYYGPYPTAGAVRDTIELLRKLCHIRTCSMKLPENQGKDRPCLYYYIGQCPAPCMKDSIRPEDYRKNVDHVISFLNGHVGQEVDMLTKKMQKASEEMRYEDAAEYRDLIESIRVIGEHQKITSGDGEDRDVIAIATDQAKENNSHMDRTEAVAQVFFVRDGRLVGREHFFLTTDDADDKPQILRDFISQYYAGTPFVPKELMIGTDIPDRELLEEMLTKRRGSKVTIRVPQRGLKEKLVELALENAENTLARDRERLQREELRTTGAVKEIADLLGIQKADRMEAFDISNISGFESVGSMIVYEKGKPKRTDYRKFKIRTVQGPNDYASMEEVLTRRFRRAEEQSPGFTRLPDLLLMDGGRGQVHIAEQVLRDTGFSFIPVAGMVKDDYHRTRGIWFHDREIPIDKNSEGFKLITRIQDEAHRFAITYHRQLRSKGQVRSVLDDIEGIGETRRKALLRSFGSVEGIRDASLDELSHAPSMNRPAAETVWNFFHGQNTPQKAAVTEEDE
ncbi:MAG: excinuclease ABC subunit UvrC [Lachnospiraceae bacterium]|jgi:excinuclease ABC subunit C|nr:excinuclease ABC subunit UvrC [Lachnospiraceae bacterium]MCH4063141.1 excinuclease ABC subunit UvrC [Lachnospiraceae bacterium]MCH4104964.1 excinuclease ABC subunit UvrC [Lachnospiraceae bacterium]MCI1308422.1 excinuclease ABC subunit UvrC [Lachnospiraceae bacterium]MCI1333180.1 excinuclease ABC subunit UvrC [Lachnospiraceae bacterium]